MPKVVHFEIPAIDAPRAIEFYAQAFGWTSTDYGPAPSGYWICECGTPEEPGVNGAIMTRIGEGQPVVTVLKVDSIDAAIAAVEAAGGEIVVPKFEVPFVGWKAFFKDTEGNIMGMAEFSQGDV
ncbi:MAG: VOC family protein [Armatimonadetes bacterium]|nr:VOC family protein [Armatimonadota bacterium]